jgi:HK97 family phage major capsid protein
MVRRNAKGVYIPYEALAYRDAATTSTANDLVYTSNWGDQYIEWLRNKTVLGQLGAQFYPGLTDSISIPKIATGSTASWVSETNTGATETQLSTDAVTLTPHLLYAPMSATKTLIAQAVAPSIDSILRDDLNRAIVGKIDETALVGASGGTGPAGVLYTHGTNLISVGSGYSFSDLVKFETEIASDNCDVAGMKYVTNAKVAGDLKTTLKDSGISGYIMENGMVNGYPLIVTNAVPNITGTQHGMLFGNWQHLLVGMWGGVDITVDQITLARSGGVVLHCHALADIALRRNESFSRCTNFDIA